MLNVTPTCAGLPGVYAAANTAVTAKRGIRSALAAHLDALAKRGQTAEPQADVMVLRYDTPDPGRSVTAAVRRARCAARPADQRQENSRGAPKRSQGWTPPKAVTA